MSCRTLFASAAFVFTGFIFISSHAEAKEISVPQCPYKTVIRQIVRLTEMNRGWKTIQSEKPVWLRSIQISIDEYSTTQTAPTILIDDTLPKVGVVSHYETNRTKAGLHDYSVVCEYNDSSAILVQKLPENATRCEVEYRNDASTSDRITIKCFDTLRAKK
jgi:hypothetical protein